MEGRKKIEALKIIIFFFLTKAWQRHPRSISQLFNGKNSSRATWPPKACGKWWWVLWFLGSENEPRMTREKAEIPFLFTYIHTFVHGWYFLLKRGKRKVPFEFFVWATEWKILFFRLVSFLPIFEFERLCEGKLFRLPAVCKRRLERINQPSLHFGRGPKKGNKFSRRKNEVSCGVIFGTIIAPFLSLSLSR